MGKRIGVRVRGGERPIAARPRPAAARSRRPSLARDRGGAPTRLHGGRNLEHKCSGTPKSDTPYSRPMFDLITKVHGLLGQHMQGLQQNPSFLPLGPNEVRQPVSLLSCCGDARPRDIWRFWSCLWLIGAHVCGSCSTTTIGRQRPTTGIPTLCVPVPAVPSVRFACVCLVVS
jgi:hypothetical protein